MTTVRDLLTVVRHALDTYVQVRELELLHGQNKDMAVVIAHQSAMRQAMQELSLLLEVSDCDS